MNKYIIIHFLTIMLFMIRISAHDINDYNSAFSEELYKLKSLKLEYEVIAENYSDGDMQVEEAILNNIITTKYVYLKKTKKEITLSILRILAMEKLNLFISQI